MTTEPSELLDEIRRSLADAGIADPAGEAALLVRETAEPQDDEAAARARALAKRRTAGAPLTELLGRVTFLGVELLTGQGVIVPRPETELLGRTAIGVLQELSQAQAHRPLRVIDMCCGAGNLACAMAVAVPEAELWASDLTTECVALTRSNVEQLSLGDRVHVFQGDLFEPLAELGLADTIDMVVCNPPYISSGRLDTDSAALWEQEPREAFDGGPYGLTVHQGVIRAAPAYLRAGGWLLFEIGLGQDRQVKMLVARARCYDEVSYQTNAAGDPRVAVTRKKVE